ncbi:MAG TPA: DUF4160 domain-containing protein [Phycisphaerae bacterium]|nr:DUF4160 domain-containing protein [Phycisphaerae bacterium]
MPEISRFYGIIITMYYLDHPPPHFHVRYNEMRATVRLDNLSVHAGKLSGRVADLVREWAVLHQEELQDNWQRAVDRRPLVPIAPLP